MASRVQGFGRVPETVERQVVEENNPEVVAAKHKPVYVDKGVLNEAVESTLENAEVVHADSMRKLWAMDQDTEAAQAYFQDQVRKQSQSRFAELGKKNLNISEVLTQDEAARVSQYAPEFSLTFRNSVNNEHGFFSSRRVVDTQIVMAKYPAGMPLLDFGGSVLHHVRQGHDNVVVVAPFDIDAKDPSRATLTRLAVRKLSVDMSASEVTRRMAVSVVRGEGVYHVSQSVQTACVQASVSMAIHVYDVPLTDWPLMMERCGVKVHEGCVHFVNDFFEADEGEFEFSGAWYEIDRGKDVFRMRVGRGSTQWYSHRWSDFMKYGANQILRTKQATYSYQIVERRADTIFYRILRIDDRAESDKNQVYALPTIPMVDVHGFAVFPSEKPGGYSSRRDMLPRVYTFPQALWERMVAHAAIEVDRGGLSYEKMFNFYRTVVPRQTINTVHVSGGQKVPLLEVPALVVMSSIVAYADILLMQRTTQAITEEVRQQRALRDESTLFKGFRAFVDSLVGIGCLPFSPFAGAATGALTNVYLALMRDKLVTWKPQVRLRSLSVAMLVDHKKLNYVVRPPDTLGLAQHVDKDPIVKLMDLARVDPNVARDVLQNCGAALSGKVKASLESVCGSETVVGSADGAGDSVVGAGEKVGVTYFMKGKKLIRRTVYPPETKEATVAWRRSAVQEALEECLEETKTMLYTCERIARDVMTHGKPNVDIMRRRCEELYNPDIWLVRNGVLVESVLNPGGTLCVHGGVYMIDHPKVSERLQPVMERSYFGAASATGAFVEREHAVLPVQYTGYALVVDGLKIFNGPAIAEALSHVLEMSDDAFDFTITCHQGPPGCGKTTTVATDGDPSCDAFFTPTRVARAGLADKLCGVHGIDARRAKDICRTIHSFLVNYWRLPDSAKQGFHALRADEYVLAREGQWIASAAMLGVKELHAYGDFQQITHKPRVTVKSFFLALKPQVLEEEFLGFRNAAEICAAYAYVYNNEIRTTVEQPGIVKRVKRFSDVVWRDNCRLLSMIQADKLLLNEIASGVSGAKKPLVNTVHEAQGSDCDQVVIYNGETRKRGPEDDFYLYGKLDYCLVAMSRARYEVIYVKASDEPDVITKMIEHSKDPRRVEACKDLSTQGQNNLSF